MIPADLRLIQQVERLIESAVRSVALAPAPAVPQVALIGC